MKKSWWKTLLTKLRPEVSQGNPGATSEPKPARVFHVNLYTETESGSGDVVLVFLDGVEVNIPALISDLEASKKNVAINSRRRDRLRVDHPEIYQKYFTKKGLKNEL